MDIEKSFPQVTEHVVLSVEGMTCVGCEKKLFRSLDLLPQIHNLKTSLVMSQAEFELNTASSTVEEIIRILERSTEFVYQKLSTAGQYLDLIPSGNVDQFITGISEQYGVLATSKLNSGIVRVEYNPRVVGARDLMSNCDDTAILLILAWAPLPEHALAYGITSLILASVVQTVVAGPFYPSAIKSLIFTRVIEMDLLIVLSTTTAYIFSIVSFAYETAGNPLPTGQFFETSTLLVTLIMLGRYISALARQRAVESISVRSLQEHTALLVKSDGFTTESIDARLLQYGDIFKIIPESRITTDGIVINGHSEVDESMITGESKPIEKLGGSQVVAGSVNISGALTIQLTRLPDENTISEIADLVDKAKFSKPKVQDMADRIASYFVPVVIVLSIITFSIWMAVSIAIRGERASVAAVNSITYAIAVLIVSCPCAIGLAIPMVVVISGGVGAKHGVIFKSSEMIEVARKVDHVIFDKTGTLTEGKMSVIEEDYFDFSKELVTRLALGMTGDIQHPVSAAVAKHLIDQDVKPELLYDLKTLPGKGIEGTWNGELIRAGNSRWLSLQSHPAVQSLLSQSLSAFCITMNDRLIGIYGLQDQLRSDALDVVTALKARNISVHIVSGDDQGAVQAIASELDIPAMNVQSKSTPSQKAEYIKSLSPAVTLFVGDGTNDAPALASASVGVHISSDTATSIAESAADIILVRPVLHGVIILLNLSKASYQRIMFNFGWAFVYNLFAILLAAGAFVGARIPPAYAGLGEIVSVLPVVAAAWALKWVKL
ncbi:putative P-type cation-transporting ATPase [Glarea lozoyensis 74030]|uniref:Putative P-type cation-transporting ATPase n=1 Tax=Glarea lozoyensis (strain ATCC 74030 / MF5533) TaxID=1104152 RepID=H0ENV7_GLAL7|nr:putative P-type cation-transporting ATPase [Glarea lozoyensis 74030]